MAIQLLRDPIVIAALFPTIAVSLYYLLLAYKLIPYNSGIPIWIMFVGSPIIATIHRRYFSNLNK